MSPAKSAGQALGVLFKKRSNFMKYVFCLFLLFCIGCAPAIKIISDYNSDGFAITDLNKTTARIFVKTNVEVLEFKKSYENEYATSARFDSAFGSQLAASLNKVMNISSVDTNELANLFIDQSFSDDRIIKVKGIFESAKENYFLGIKKVIISNKTTNSPGAYTPPTTMSTPGGSVSFGGGTTGGYTSEDCVVTARVEVWSVKEKKKVCEFTSIGKSTVTFFAYVTALKDAVKDAIDNIRIYVEKNKKE
jgi:hypothetical protein